MIGRAVTGRQCTGGGAEGAAKTPSGMCVFIPAGAADAYENTGDAPFEFLCIVPNLEDKTMSPLAARPSV
jgi:oxalate decarboxylase/phosphoglucose isomerase-like protein (cupin superfamily)